MLDVSCQPYMYVFKYKFRFVREQRIAEFKYLGL